MLLRIPLVLLLCGAGILCSAWPAPDGPLWLQNKGLRVGIHPQTGALISVENRLTQQSYSTKALAFSLETTAGELSAAKVTGRRQLSDGVEFIYVTQAATVTVRYRLPRGQDFLEKVIEVKNLGPLPLLLRKVVMERIEFEPAFEQIHPHHDPSQFRWLINLFLRGRKGGFYFGIENPVYQYWTKGETSGTSWIQLEYHPNVIVPAGKSHATDVCFLGTFRKEKIYLFKELGKLQAALKSPKAIPSALNFQQEILDWGEVWAMQDYLRARQPPHDTYRPGFYVRAVAMIGGRKTAQMGQQTGFHIAFGPEHVEGSKRFVDDVATLGHIPHIEWATEWFGLGGYANPTKDFALENAGPGDSVPVNPHWMEVVKYGWQKGIRAGIFETVSRNFARGKSAWKVLRSDGIPWGWSDPPLPTNCWANRQYANWRLEVTDQAIRDYKLYMVAYDGIVPADWSWLGWPVIQTECFATNHGHPPGDVSYLIFRNIVWFLEELQKRHPKAALRVASGLTTAYPWVLKDLIEYHPNLYDGETGATYWTSYNFRFLPMYKSGVLLSATSRAPFQWLLLRSISVSDHFMLWPDAVGIALENRDFWTKWLTWADQNIQYLRVGRTLFREPWGDTIVASLPPALEGRLPAPSASLHGSAHCVGDRGFLFLFNPSSQARVGIIPLNHWVGLNEGEQFAVRLLHPKETPAYGPYHRGEELRIEVPAQGALVLQVLPAVEAKGKGKPRVSPKAPVDKAFLSWEEIPWKEIQPAP